MLTMLLSFTPARASRRAEFNQTAEPIRTFLLLQRDRPSPHRQVPGLMQIELIYSRLPLWRRGQWLRAWARYELASRGRNREAFNDAVDRCLRFIQPR